MTTSGYALPMQRDVAAFHAAFEMPDLIATPGPLPEDRIDLRIGLLREEGVRELGEDSKAGDVVKTIDALLDTVYVALGALVEMGQQAGAEVHVDDEITRPLRRQALCEMAQATAASNGMYLSILEAAFRRGDTARSVDLLEQIIAGALINLVYCGVDPAPFFAEIQRGNMSKLGADGRPVKSRGMALDGYPEGKVLKGANYVPTDLRPVFLELYGEPTSAKVSLDFERGVRAAAAMSKQLTEVDPDVLDLAAQHALRDEQFRVTTEE